MDVGGDSVIAAKQTVKGSLTMVEQMATDPPGVLAALNSEEQEKLRAALPSLATQADEVQRTGVGLLALAEAVHRLIKGIPTLAGLFPPTQMGVTRSGKEEDLDAMFFGKQAQEQAAQIYNSVAKLDQGIKQEIQNLGQRSNYDHGQTSPSN